MTTSPLAFTGHHDYRLRRKTEGNVIPVDVLDRYMGPILQQTKRMQVQTIVRRWRYNRDFKDVAR